MELSHGGVGIGEEHTALYDEGRLVAGTRREALMKTKGSRSEAPEKSEDVDGMTITLCELSKPPILLTPRYYTSRNRNCSTEWATIHMSMYNPPFSEPSRHNCPIGIRTGTREQCWSRVPVCGHNISLTRPCLFAHFTILF